jgi:rubrerythrin
LGELGVGVSEFSINLNFGLSCPWETAIFTGTMSTNKSLKGSRTEQNLLKAFAGESQARNRYEFFASVAKKEGFEQIAGIFLTTASQEKEHAKRFFKFLEGGDVEITAAYPAGKIGTTAENLKAAAAGENEEWTKLYPEFAKVAREEGFAEVAAAFTMISKVEAEHEKRYLKLLDNVEKGKVFVSGEKKRWVCRNCGYVHEGDHAPEKCPACLHPQSYYELEAQNY